MRSIFILLCNTTICEPHPLHCCSYWLGPVLPGLVSNSWVQARPPCFSFLSTWDYRHVHVPLFLAPLYSYVPVSSLFSLLHSMYCLLTKCHHIFYVNIIFFFLKSNLLENKTLIYILRITPGTYWLKKCLLNELNERIKVKELKPILLLRPHLIGTCGKGCETGLAHLRHPANLPVYLPDCLNPGEQALQNPQAASAAWCDSI